MARHHGRPARPAWVGIVVIPMLVLAGCTSTHHASSTTTAPSHAPSASVGSSSVGASAAIALQNAFVGVVQKVLPSVVEIRASGGLGSGVIYDSRGDIVTNAHVVDNATTFQVRLSSGAASIPATRQSGRTRPTRRATPSLCILTARRPCSVAGHTRTAENTD